ncbi:MAG: hypothetical protein OEZ59_10695 [Deltaproteobacteria bacterium]|nr:hypothetical protein [Deltaproteobacteria bacterium]
MKSLKYIIPALMCVLFVQPVMGQVATVNLASSGDVLPANPAALQWSVGNTASLLLMDGDAEFGFSNTTVVADGPSSSTVASFHYAGESFAIGAGAGSRKSQLKDSGSDPMFGGAYELKFENIEKGNGLGISLKLMDMLSLGASVRSFDSEMKNWMVILAIPVESWEKYTGKEQTLGASMRLTDTFFLGASMGNINTSYTDSNNNEFEGKRGVSNFGVGILSKGSSGNAFRLEASVHKTGSYDNKDLSQAVDKATDISMEFIYSSFLVSMHSKKETTTDAGETEVSKNRIVALGWSPSSGLSVSAGAMRADVESSDAAGPILTGTNSMKMVSVGWNF